MSLSCWNKRRTGTHAWLTLMACLVLWGCQPPEIELGPAIGRSADMGVASEGGERPRNYTSIPLRSAAGLSTQLPDYDGRWFWTRDERWLLVAHAGADQRPDVLFWALTPTALPNLTQVELQMVTHELALWHDLRQWPTPPSHQEWVAAEGSTTAPPGDDVRHIPAMALTDPTVGHGLGFVPRFETFSGWRWSGYNRLQAHLRLAHVRGTWQLPVRPDSLLLASFASLPRLASPRLPSSSGFDEVAALLVMGVVQAGGIEVPFAVLCRAEPFCAQGDALLGLLRQLNVDAAAADARAGGRLPPTSLEAFADRAGLVWQSGDWTRALAEAIRQSRQGGREASGQAE